MSRVFPRRRIPELMDDPGLDPGEHRLALAGLARINAVSGSAGVLLKPLRQLAKNLGRPIRVLDVATGSGDVPVAMSRKLKDAEFAACDISPTAIAAAQQASSAVRFFVHDVLKDPLPDGFDAVTCSLFLHHLADDEAVVLLKRMAAAGAMVLVNDLARSRFNLMAVWLACHVLSRSRVVRFDGPASVRSAYTAEEARLLAEKAGLNGATVRSRFPSRFLLQWSKHD